VDQGVRPTANAKQTRSDRYRPPASTATLTLSLAFSNVAGNRIFYLAVRDAADQNNTGWKASGTRTLR